MLTDWPRSASAIKYGASLAELLAGRDVVETPHLVLDLPQRFEYGNTVPLGVAVDAPMTVRNHVERVDLFAEGNPFPQIASFHFTPQSGRATASTRIRLNEGPQEVVAVALWSDGTTWIARRTAEIAQGGCKGATGVARVTEWPVPKPRLKAPVEARRGEIIDISTMISHWMETGLRSDTEGRPIPRRIIHRVVCSQDGRTIFAADLYPAVAANAYLTFPMLVSEPGILNVAWSEDGGAVYHAAHSLGLV